MVNGNGIIDINRATELAYEYRQVGDIGILEMSELLSYILWSDDNNSIFISNIAFAWENENENKKLNGDNDEVFSSPLAKYEKYGFINKNEIELFVFYFKWSLNYDAVKLRDYANIIDILSNENSDKINENYIY